MLNDNSGFKKKREKKRRKKDFRKGFGGVMGTRQEELVGGPAVSGTGRSAGACRCRADPCFAQRRALVSAFLPVPTLHVNAAVV